jgi:hypothetical protein
VVFLRLLTGRGIFLFNDVLYGEKTRERFKNFRSNLLAGQVCGTGSLPELALLRKKVAAESQSPS